MNPPIKLIRGCISNRTKNTTGVILVLEYFSYICNICIIITFINISEIHLSDLSFLNHRKQTPNILNNNEIILFVIVVINKLINKKI
jgi:membrane-bound metal-dependent hydrolase YbcI (DUF457 family)